jgi:hypothetical protein
MIANGVDAETMPLGASASGVFQDLLDKQPAITDRCRGALMGPASWVVTDIRVILETAVHCRKSLGKLWASARTS